MCLWLGAPEGMSPSFQVWWPWALWWRRYNSFSFSHDLARPTLSKGHVTLKVGARQAKLTPAKFGGHRHYVSSETTVLFFT